MSEQTGISWTDHTFNPWWGCQKVSPACASCYAERDSKRYGWKVWGLDSERRFFGNSHWIEPIRWNIKAALEGVRRRVFCASMADVFEDRADLVDTRERLFTLIDETPHLDWLLLSKRPENMARLMPQAERETPRENVWLGTTAEDQEYLNLRVPHLLKVPAAKHFLSLEPLLGPISFRWSIWDNWNDATGVRRDEVNEHDGLRMLDWIICGGESGAKPRTIDPAWVRQIRDECQAAGVPFHFKQWGGHHPKANGRELDGREWVEFPTVQA